MKKLLCLTGLFLVLGSLSFAQNLHDPSDAIYSSIDRWAARGYLSMLPQVRPYPRQLVEEYLLTVEANGDTASAKEAGAYLDALKGRAVHAGGTASVSSADGDRMYMGIAQVDGRFKLQDWLTASFDFGIVGSTKAVGDEVSVPGTWSPYADMVNDDSKVGPLNILQDWNSTAAIGTSRIWFQAGFNRTSFGPFFDSSLVIGDQAGHAGHFSTSYRGEKWGYSQVLLTLSASSSGEGVDTDNDGTADTDLVAGEGQFPSKYISLHSFDFRVTDKFEFGFFESIVWGNRFEPLYLVPFNFMFQAQALTDTACEDNSFLGLNARYTFFPGFQALGQLYVDDASFKDMVKLDFETKWKFSAEAGLQYVPASGPLAKISGGYTAVMPYMGTHKSSVTVTSDGTSEDGGPWAVNYSNYTHLGEGLGTDLLPNSDRLEVNTSWIILPVLKGKLSATLQRHGNASANGANAGDTTSAGDNYDDGYTDEGKSTFNNETRFLTQDVIETLLQGGAGLEWVLPLPTVLGTFSASVDCVLEYGMNRDLVKDDDSWAVYYLLGGKWTY